MRSFQHEIFLIYLVQLSKGRVELGDWEIVFFSFQRKSHILSMSFLIHLGIVYIDQLGRFGLRLSFSLLKRVSLSSRYNFFCYTFTFFCPIGVIKHRVTKINSKHFNGKLRPFNFSWLINSIFVCSRP